MPDVCKVKNAKCKTENRKSFLFAESCVKTENILTLKRLGGGDQFDPPLPPSSPVVFQKIYLLKRG